MQQLTGGVSGMRLLALLLFIVAASGSVNANDGDIFDGFGTDAEYPGMGFYPNTFPEGDLDFAVVTLPAANGKLYLIANMDTGPGQRLSIYRLEANGLDRKSTRLNSSHV